MTIRETDFTGIFLLKSTTSPASWSVKPKYSLAWELYTTLIKQRNQLAAEALLVRNSNHIDRIAGRRPTSSALQLGVRMEETPKIIHSAQIGTVMTNKMSHGLPFKVGKGIALNILVSIVVVAALHLFFYLIG